MKFPWRLSIASLTLLFATTANAQHAQKTDAQTDGFVGPVKSVSTAVSISGPDFIQPGGPTIYLPIFCNECAYDSDGTRTRIGQMNNGQFNGEMFKLERDSTGRVTERWGYDANTGELTSHRLMGPFGITEQDQLLGNKEETREIVGYDGAGNRIESQTFEANGDLVRQIDTHWDRDGNMTEEKASHRDGSLEWLRTYDPSVDKTRFEHFDDTGTLTLDWTVQSGNLISFWKSPDSPRQMGDNFNDWGDHGDEMNYACEGNRCEISRIHYEYLDGSKLHFRSAEWRDADGTLQYGAYYEYEFDSKGNWTQRKVYVVTPKQSERTLYETDARTITYWQ